MAWKWICLCVCKPVWKNTVVPWNSVWVVNVCVWVCNTVVSQTPWESTEVCVNRRNAQALHRSEFVIEPTRFLINQSDRLNGPASPTPGNTDEEKNTYCWSLFQEKQPFVHSILCCPSVANVKIIEEREEMEREKKRLGLANPFSCMSDMSLSLVSIRKGDRYQIETSLHKHH